MLFSVEQAFVGREEIRAPLKTPAWEATILLAAYSLKTQSKKSTSRLKQFATFCNIFGIIKAYYGLCEI